MRACCGAANWTVRIVLLAVAGSLTFSAHWPGRLAFTVQVIAFSIGVLVFAGWALGRPPAAPRARLRAWQPYALGAVIVSTSSWPRPTAGHSSTSAWPRR